MKKAIIVILALFLIPLVSASPELEITNSLNATIYHGINYQTTISAKNIGNETMYNLSFSDIQNVLFTNIPDTIQPNETKLINITINPVAMDAQSTIQFYTLTNTTSIPQTYQVSIQTNSIVPNSIQIRQNDAITWTNTASQQHSVIATMGQFSYQLQPSQQITHTFNSIGLISYYDGLNGIGASIDVISNIISTRVHDSTKDKTLRIITTTQASPTTLYLETIPTDLSLSYNEQKIGKIYLKNTGTVSALNIHLEGNWTTFGKNNFQLNPDIDEYLDFNLTPKVTSTNQTNKSYQIKITATGNNFEQKEKTISVFIRYHDFSTSTDNGTTIIVRTPTYDEIIQMCNSGLINCPTSNQTQIIYQDKIVPYNLTYDDIKRMIDLSNQNADANTRIMNALIEHRTIDESKLDETMKIANETNEFMRQTKEEIKKDKDRNFILNLIIWIFIILLTIGGISYYFIMKSKSKSEYKSEYL